MNCHGLRTVDHFVASLKACAQKKDLRKGAELHAHILRKGSLEKNPCVGSALVSMYAKCGAFVKAQEVLYQLPIRDEVSWNALIAGYAQYGQGMEAVNCFENMQRDGLAPNVVTYACILKACGGIGAAEVGKQVHDEIVCRGLLGKHIVLGNTLIDMYVKFGALAQAEQVFDELPVRDIVSWNVLIAGYAQQGQEQKALECVELIQGEGLSLDVFTFSCILQASGNLKALDKGIEIHDEIVNQGLLGKSVVLGNALVDMYARCGSLKRAQQLLIELPTRNLVSWNTLIIGYTREGFCEEALNCWECMQREGLSPNVISFICILKACGSIGMLHKGKQVYDDIVSQGLLGKDVILGTSLVDMYVKCGAIEKAHQVLNELPVKDVISWNALITGYTKKGLDEEVLNCIDQMQGQDIFPDSVTFTCILKACGSIGIVDKGKLIHNEIVSRGLFKENFTLGTALVDMYAKCGALAEAQQVLDDLPVRSVVPWNALIDGYAQEGLGVEAMGRFEQMQSEGLSPDAATFTCLLNVCSRSGCLDEVQMYMTNMSNKYGITPGIEHYTLIVDLFGRAGHFDNAVAVIKMMPSFNNPLAWCALLGACLKCGNVKLGRWVFDCALQEGAIGSEAYSCIAKIYSAVGMQDNAVKVESLRLENTAQKRPG